MLIRFAFALLLMASSTTAGAGDITLCPGPDERYRSPLYQVDVDEAGPAFVYYRENGWKQVPDKKGGNWEYESMSADNNWIALSGRGTIFLTVRPVGMTAAKAELLPDRSGNTIAVAEDGTVRVKLRLDNDGADYYFVRINGEYGNKHPLFVFADPPETQPAPRPGPGVHIFGPGVHDIGAHYALESGETAYIAAGAVVRGTFSAHGSGITIRGRGVLSGELLQEEWIRYKRGLIPKPENARSYGIAPMVWHEDWSGDTVLEGITVIDAPSYNVTLNGKKMEVRNVKLLSWNYSSDGVSGAGGLVENCFFKVNDDVFTVYRSDLTARNLVIWKQSNAAVFQLGYGYGMTVQNCLAERIDIIRDETDTQCAARGIMSLTASKGCSFRNMRFQDIKVYGDTLNLLAIDNLDQDTPWSAKVENVTLREIDLELRRVTVTGTERGQWWTPFMDRRGQPMRSRLRTADPGRIRVLFDDVSINGIRLRSAHDFPNGLETEGDVKLIFE